MGRGDKRTAKGKRFKGSYGNTRPQRAAKSAVVKPAEPKVKAAAKTAAPAAPKKTAAKKTAAKKKAE